MSGAGPDAGVRIVEYAPAHRDPFRDLNLAWITEHFEVEEGDRKVLGDPEAHILRPGGFIFMAEEGGRVLGTCALIRNPDGSFELAKMAVAPAARGRGIGRLLGEAAVERARRAGAPYVELVSNRRLLPALRLYESLGFVERPMAHNEYRRADIRMVLDFPR